MQLSSAARRGSLVAQPGIRMGLTNPTSNEARRCCATVTALGSSASGLFAAPALEMLPRSKLQHRQHSYLKFLFPVISSSSSIPNSPLRSILSHKTYPVDLSNCPAPRVRLPIHNDTRLATCGADVDSRESHRHRPPPLVICVHSLFGIAIHPRPTHSPPAFRLLAGTKSHDSHHTAILQYVSTALSRFPLPYILFPALFFYLFTLQYSPNNSQLTQFTMARCYDSFGNVYPCQSAWNNWGRWVALGVIILGAFLLFFLFRYVIQYKIWL